MATPKAQTLQQRFGFADKDLTTPKHDEIMVWLDANLEKVIKELWRWEPITEERITHAREKAQEAICEERVKRQKNLTDAQANLETARREYQEESLKYRRKFPDSTREYSTWQVDNARDKVVNCTKDLQEALDWNGLGPIPAFDTIRIESNIWEYAIATSNNSKFIVGFIDLLAVGYLSNLGVDLSGLPKWARADKGFKMLFEVKSSIPSLGEAIRQIRMYQTHIGGIYVIVSPDDRFADALRAQGIEFYKCPGAVADIWDSVA